MDLWLQKYSQAVMNRLFVILIIGLLLSSCQKEDVEKEPTIFSEIIYGTWEWREDIDVLTHGDWEYHPTLQPFPICKFFESDSFVIIVSGGIFDQDTFEMGMFIVNDQDSILTLHYSDYQVHGFSEDTLDLRFQTREGPGGRKLFKLD